MILNNKKLIYINRVDKLIKLKKCLYENIDISEPMGKKEKQLNTLISNLFSEINLIILEKRKLKL